MLNTPPKVDGKSIPKVEEWNSINNELQNIVRKANLEFDANDEHQLTKAVKVLANNNVYFTDSGSQGNMILNNENINLNGTAKEGLILRFWSNNLVVGNTTAKISNCDPIHVVSPFDDTPSPGVDLAPYNPKNYKHGIVQLTYQIYYDARVLKNINSNIVLRVNPITLISNHIMPLLGYINNDSSNILEIYTDKFFGSIINLRDTYFSPTFFIRIIIHAQSDINFNKIMISDTTGHILLKGNITEGQTMYCPENGFILVNFYPRISNGIIVDGSFEIIKIIEV